MNPTIAFLAAANLFFALGANGAATESNQLMLALFVGLIWLCSGLILQEMWKRT